MSLNSVFCLTKRFFYCLLCLLIMTEQNYGADNITVLEGLEAVRKRPGMYIGNTGKEGLHRCLGEILDNSVDEHMGDFADTILVKVRKDNSILVADNGRGIPTDIHSKTGRPALETILTVLHAGGKFDRSSVEPTTSKPLGNFTTESP